MNVFERALEIIGEHGWGQGAGISANGTRCLEQAWLEAAAQLHPWKERRLESERSRLARVSAHRARHDREEAALRSAAETLTGPFTGPLRWWNDDPARSEEDIRLALKNAAAATDRTGRTGQ